MKTLVSFANVVKTVAAIAVLGLSFVGCQKDDLADHSNEEEGKAKFTITDEPKPGPQPVLSDSVWGKVIGDTLIIVHDSLKNDTVFKSEQESIGFSASVEREFNERKTTVERIKKLDFSFEDAVNKQNGKMQFEGSQKGSDADAQNYTLTFASEKLSKWGLNNVHFELVGTNTPEVKNTDIEKKASDSIRIKSEMTWPLTIKVVNVPNLEGKTFSSSMLNKTNHERYISYGDPVLVRRDTTMTPTYGIWSTEWLLKVVETYRVNGHDSIAPAQTKKVNLVSTCGIDKNEDAFVGSLDFNHNFTSEKWGDWYSVESADKAVSVQERKFERLGTGSNGIEKDKFNTKSYVTEQKATVVFAGLTWNIPATNATLTNVRHTFLDNLDSDIDGYSMIKFVDDEIATYAGATEGDNYKKLNSSCKLYLKVATPEVESFLFDQTVVRTTKKVTVTTVATPVYDNGTKGDSAKFVLNLDETFKCLNNISFEKIQEMSEVTGTLVKDGEVSIEKNQKFEVEAGGYKGTYTCNKYTQKYVNTVTSNGVEQKHNWEAVWYDDFEFELDGKKNTNSYDKVKSTSVSNAKDDNHLTKSTSLSTEELEVYLYACNGTFTIDGVDRSDIAPGTFTKVVIGENHWDESTKGREITALEVKSWCEFIRFKSDGTKTSQKYTHVFNRVSGTSTWEVSAEKAEEVNGNIIPLAPVDNNRIDDFCHFTARLYEYDMMVDIQGAAQQKDFAKFTEAEEMYFEVEGKKVYFENPTHSISNTVRDLTVKSESDSETVYQHENVWSWNYGGVVTEVTSTGLIHVAKSSPVTPDFDIEVGSIYASVSRPSNRNASDITAYTYLLVSKDGKKCLPIGIYHDVVTVGEITNMQASFNSACYVKDENKVVATRAYSDSGLGMMLWCGADGNPVDAASHLVLQGAGFNDRGNDWINHTGKYAPKATKKGNVTVVTFEGTNVSYTFRGWNVQ